MASPLRIGLIGCGAIATAVHLRVLRAIPGVHVSAIADPAPEARARACTLVRGAASLATCAELLARDDVDAVVVTAPSGVHAELAQAVLQSGKHLYLEKPIACTVEDGRRVVDEARRARVVAAVGFNWRFQPLVVRAHELIRRGVLGEVRTISSEFCEPSALPDWKTRRSLGGGVLLDLGSHHFDLFRWLLRAEVAHVDAELRSELSEHDSASVRLDLGGARGARSDFSFRARRADWIEIVAERGTLRIDRYARTLTLRGARARTVTLATLAWRGRALVRPRTEPSWRNALHAFVARIRGRDVELPTMEDGLRSLEIVARAERAAGVP